MNTKIYKQVHKLATDLLTAAQKENVGVFTALYEQLKAICYEHENSEKNHPVQWETLADFTEESDDALRYYQIALSCAEKIASHDFIASINYAMAVIYEALDQPEDTLKHVKDAAKSSPKIQDSNLQEEIKALLESF
jgi:hypothetical protein